MTSTATPKAPAGLRKSGRALWRALLRDFDLDEHEAALLVQACRLADHADELQAILDRDGLMATSSQGSRTHPALAELRQVSIALARILTALRVPTGEETGDNRTQRRPGVRGVYAVR